MTDLATPELASSADYALLDAGGGRRLERFGERLVDRPAAGAVAPRREPTAWRDADLRFDPGRGWSGPASAAGPWPIKVAGLTMELRTTSSGGVGLYPEHAANLSWLEARIRERATARPTPPALLNLFAHTGLATLAAARSGALVAHVDAARASVSWARRNAGRSGLDDRPVRWLVDDAQAFVGREARRGRHYDGIVLDPPSHGHAGRVAWHLLSDLPSLLVGCAAVATPDAFVLLTIHTTGVDADTLRPIITAAFPGSPADWTWEPLELRATSGARLSLGWSARREPASHRGGGMMSR